MSASTNETVVIKKYANRRLYNTATSTYVTLEDLAAMVKKGIEFNVYDAKSSEDITRSVLTQIIVEEEGKAGQNLLPISFHAPPDWFLRRQHAMAGAEISGAQHAIADEKPGTNPRVFPERLWAACSPSAARWSKWASKIWRCSNAR